MNALIYALSKFPRAERVIQGLILAAGFAAMFQSAQGKDTINAIRGQTFYTQFSLCHEDGVHVTTNYRKGQLVPVNTEVTFIKASGGSIQVKLSDGAVLKLENEKNFSGEDIAGIFKRTFGKEKVDLAGFPEKVRQNILAGAVEPGMTKEAVVKAIGYPPKHQTASLDKNNWRYWRHRFGTFVVNFEDGKVSGLTGKMY